MTSQAKRKCHAASVPSIGSSDGQPVAHRFALRARAARLRHGAHMALLQHAHGPGQGQATARLAQHRADRTSGA